MSARRVVPRVVVGALVLVALVGGSSPAHVGADPRVDDLLASAHPTTARPASTDDAFTQSTLRGPAIAADTAALTSTTCEGCVGESTALHVLYVPRARRASLDNVATAWAQECEGCASTALSVQVVVLRGVPATEPNNRALSLTAACVRCRTSALAYQVVLVADRAAPLGDDDLAALRAWFEEQAAVLRATVAAPLPDPPVTESTPTLAPTSTPTSAHTPVTSPSPTRPTSVARPVVLDPRRLPRRATSALDELEALLGEALDADIVSSDVEIGR